MVRLTNRPFRWRVHTELVQEPCALHVHEEAAVTCRSESSADSAPLTPPGRRAGVDSPAVLLYTVLRSRALSRKGQPLRTSRLS